MEKEQVTLEDAKDHGLIEEEFEEIKRILGRIPNSTELGIFSGMWSEHCSYKNSIKLLKTLPTESKKLLTKTGDENAGAMDIGDGLAVVFKIESHNHPTAVEPYQGAATGVGGIMRDIFTMGARPILSLNSLRFGNPDNNPRNSYLLKRAVKGIGDYGNSLGIAVSGGELFFDDSFSVNPLVNAMTVGIVSHTKMASASTKGKVGYSVFIVGATTGRDGIHGASFASKDLTKETEEKRSAVQVGDPFMEKLLLEASLEAIDKDLLIGIQDMGAAGISCSTSEMSAKGKTGMEINLDLVPYRETGMNAYEAMLSESQERMLVVPKKGKESELIEVFHKWGLNAVEIGKVTDDGILRVSKDGKVKAEIPADSLVLGGGAPRYTRETQRPKYLDEMKNLDLNSIPDVLPEGRGTNSIYSILLKLIAGNNICSRRPLYEQYDTDVGLVKVIGPGGDGGVARVPGTMKGIAVSTDCNSRYTYLDPYKGAIWAVFESARNIAVTGATPLGLTNNLNFANPYIPENYYMFSECVRGIGDACRALEIPVTGGNVSFYNESPQGPVYPTPTIGLVGLIENIQKTVGPFIKQASLHVGLIGFFKPTLSASEYLKEIHGITRGEIPELNMEEEIKLIKTLNQLAEESLLHSAKDISLGGLATALCKTAFGGKVGIEIDLEKVFNHRYDETLFGETAASAVISFSKDKFEQIKKICDENQVPFTKIGESIAVYRLKIHGPDVSWRLEDLEILYEKKLESVFE